VVFQSRVHFLCHFCIIPFVEIPSLYGIAFYLIVAIKLEKQGTMIATS
jgi:hypothetical protein